MTKAMPNPHNATTKVQICTSFRGETKTFTANIDLNKIMATRGSLADIHHIIATSNHIDQYDYLYEVIQSEPISIVNPTGLVAQCIDEQGFNIALFEQLWQHNRPQIAADHIAKTLNLTLTPECQKALIMAFEMGQENRIE